MMKYCTALFLICCMLLAAHCSDPANDTRHIRQLQASAQPIIDALEKYKLDQGSYPASLEQLTPKYLKTPPKPNWGVNQWTYGVSTIPGKANYSLGVEKYRNNYVGYYYDSAKKDWCYDQ